MEESLFIDLIKKYFPGIIVRITNELNGKIDANNTSLTYLHQTMLTKTFSVTGKWEAFSILNKRVSADYVSMDSRVPLKIRDKVEKQTGDIIKSGMELWLNETQLTDLDTMVKIGAPESQIVAQLFEDMDRCVTGIYELMERSFLQGLSTGICEISDADNVGLSIRLNYGYYDENKFGYTYADWTDYATAKPLEDIRAVLKKAKDDGNTITNIFMDQEKFNDFINCDSVKTYYAWSLSKMPVNQSSASMYIGQPTLDEINRSLYNDPMYRVTITVIDRRIIVERDGTRKSINPWEVSNVIFTTTTNVGILAWAKLAEDNHRVPGVEYQVVNDYILASKYRKNEPALSEYSKSQARVVPVIASPESIYLLDTTEPQG